jgi:4-hydroxybenzoyl-CoA thioesterase
LAYSTTIKIRFDDVDGAGIVYYPQYFHLCHAAFEDYFDSTAHISYPEHISKKRLGFPTVAIHSNFTAPLVYGDTAIINIAIKKIGGSSLVLPTVSGVNGMGYYVLKQV